MYIYHCKIERWIDGDTVDLVIDIGLRGLTMNERARVAHINCPETSSKDVAEKIAGEAARKFAFDLAPPGTLITVVTRNGGDYDKYGRWLTEITLPDGRDFSKEIMKAGHAIPYEGGKR